MKQLLVLLLSVVVVIALFFAAVTFAENTIIAILDIIIYTLEAVPAFFSGFVDPALDMVRNLREGIYDGNLMNIGG